ncbi:MAG: DEAD/DEAH box helicase [Akkermansiaceae bacterium]|nr:DEAD/DEAH box helicase [Akkermansiaceae bacterium]
MPATASIRDFLADGTWQTRFDEHVLALGQKDARKRRVHDLALDDQADGGHLLTARVHDEELGPCDVEVSLWPESATLDFETDCPCPYAHFCPHAAAVLFAAAKPSALDRLMKGGSVQVPVQAARAAAPAPTAVVDAPPPEFQIEVRREPASSRPVQLLLQALRSPDRDSWIVARPTVRYGDHVVPLATTGDSGVTVETAGGPAELQRDRPAEFRAAEDLAKVGLTHLAAQPSYRFLLGIGEPGKRGGLSSADAFFPEPSLGTPDVYWPWFRAKAARRLEAAGWSVTIDDEIDHPLYEVDTADFDAALTLQPGGWFALSVGFEVDGERLDLLPILVELLEGDTLDQLRGLPPEERHLVYLPNGGALHLPAGRLRRILRHLASLVDPRKPHLHPIDAARLAADPGLEVSAPADLTRLAQALGGKAGAPPPPPPAGLQATLRPYQLTGFQWLQFLARHQLHGILADDMGLGKTLQTLAFLLDRRESGANGGKPSLVVAPTSVVPNWRAEARKFTPALRVLVLQGPKRKKDFPAIPHADLVITSYALLQRDADQLAGHDFDTVILDEAQHIKNPTAKVARAACRLQAAQRLCLSGTPVENHLGDLWSLMRFLIPGFLGSLDHFRTRFQHPIEKDEDEECRAALQQRLGPLILRRNKDEVATELPPKTILVHPVELTTAQKDLYETVRATMDKSVRAAIAARGVEQSQIVLLDALLKLRQICCHPALLRDDSARELLAAGDPSAKLTYLMELLGTLVEEGRRILLFSQFTSMLTLIERELSDRGTRFLKLTGSSKDRGALVGQFQSGEVPLFLISLKAGGTGLNLTAADTVIHYDPWWNPATENQATDRAYRIGQEKPVFVHKLLCSGTVEDRIHKLQDSKSRLAATILDAASKTTPDPETLQSLLAPLD